MKENKLLKLMRKMVKSIKKGKRERDRERERERERESRKVGNCRSSQLAGPSSTHV